MKSHRFRFIRVLLIWIAFLSGGVSASEREYALKAGFMFNFARFSSGNWFSPENDNEYKICSPDTLFVRTATETLKGQQVQGRPIKVTELIEPIFGCHSLFISDKLYSSYRSVFAREQFKNTMIVGETKGFIEDGGQIRFFIAGGKIRFEVDPEKLKKSGIKMSSKVLRMGRIVEAAKR